MMTVTQSTFGRYLGLLLALLATTSAADSIGVANAPPVSHQPMVVRTAHSFGNGHGWATDGQRLMVTSDNGRHWTNITPAAANHIQTVFFSNPRVGWVIANHVAASNVLDVFSTIDGGRSWVKLPPISTEWPGTRADSATFLDRNHGWLLLQVSSSSNFSFGRLLVTHNGGASWQRLPQPPAAGTIRFRTPTDGVLIGGAGQPNSWATHDGGRSWQRTTAIRERREQTTRADNRLAGYIRPGEAVVQARIGPNGSGWVIVQGGSCAVAKSQCRQHARLLALSAGSNAVDITPTLPADAGHRNLIEIESSGLGFDKCAAPPTHLIDNWWSGTPWVWTNIYIGGENRGCAQYNLDAGWVDTVLDIGFTLVPTWVGPQAPGSVCGSCSTISSNPSTAHQQGINEAYAASDAADALGLHAQTIIYYDMEAYSPSNQAAVNAFIDGWVAGMHYNGNLAGVYGSPYQIYYYAGLTHEPDAIWPAQWISAPYTHRGVYDISKIPDSWWNDHQRLRQYRGGHNSTYNGVTFNIDTNTTDGPTAAGGCSVSGQILPKYQAMGGPGGILGPCTTDTNPTASGGQYNHFQNGSIYWKNAAAGAHEVHGSISDKWNSLTWELGPLGYPVTDQRPTLIGNGQYNEFENGAIYKSSSTGTHAVYGAIFDKWDAMGRVYSCLGYPVSDEYDDNGAQRNDFQFGYISWTSSGGAIAHCSGERIFVDGFDYRG